MSIWTHVAGIIYFDDFFEKDEDFKILHFNDIPEGSEGSLNIKTENEILGFSGNKPTYGRIMVAIWGDLRDYEDHSEIFQYFKQITDKDHRFVRNGVLEIEVENGRHLIYKYGKEDDWDLVLDETDDS